jgi:hypothetical protein
MRAAGPSGGRCRRKDLFSSFVECSTFYILSFAEVNRVAYACVMLCSFFMFLLFELHSGAMATMFNVCTGDAHDAALPLKVPYSTVNQRLVGVCRAAALQRRKALSLLQRVNLTKFTDVTESGIASVATMTSIRQVVLQQCDLNHSWRFFFRDAWSRHNVSDMHVASLAPLRLLQRLDLTGAVLTDSGLQMISSHSHLRHLTLDGCISITDIGLAFLPASLPDLRYLDISWCSKITDEGLASVAKLNRLHTLIFGPSPHITMVGDNYVKHVPQRTWNKSDLILVESPPGAGKSSLLTHAELFRLHTFLDDDDREEAPPNSPPRQSVRRPFAYHQSNQRSHHGRIMNYQKRAHGARR